jgi:hypothetical protein
MSRQLRRSVACLNCGATVDGNFCAECGQENTDYRVSLRRLLGDLVDEVFQLESRLWRTLWTLFRHPGRLTVEYAAGHRVRYTTPLRLYLLASVTYFFVASITPRAEIPKDALGDFKAKVTIDVTDSPAERELGRKLQQRMEGLRDNPQAAVDRMFAALLEWSPRLMALLLPFFALLTSVFFRNPRLYFVEHLVFALHMHAATFVLWTMTNLAHDRPGLIVSFGSIVWFLVAARTVFRQSWPHIAWKAPLIAMVYFMVVGMGMAGILLFGLFNV